MIKAERKATHMRLLNTENKQGCWRGSEWGGWAKWVMGILKGTCRDEHLVSYVRMNHWVLLLKPTLHSMLTNLNLNKLI